MNFKESILFIIFITVITSLLLTFQNSPGWTVAVVMGTGAENQIRRLRNVRNHSAYQNHLDALADLETEKVDVVVMDYLSILNIMKEPGEEGLKLVGERLTHTKGRVAFKPEDDALRYRFNQALLELIEDGTYQKLSLKHFGTDQLDAIKPSKATHLKPFDDWIKIQKNGVIKFGIIFNNPPFCYYDQQNRLTGFEVELAEAISQQLRVECLLTEVEWNEAIDGLIGQSYDGLWAGINNFPKFRRKVEFSLPYFDSGAQLVVKRGSPITGPRSFERRLTAFDLLLRRM